MLSDSTADYDRGRKFEYYRTIPSLREYLTIAQDKVHLEHWLRQSDDRWLLTEYRSIEQLLEFSVLAITVKVSDLYRRVEFPH